MSASDAQRTDDLVQTWAAEPLDETDHALLASLRTCLSAADPVPPGLVDRIRFEITLDALHAEIATLTRSTRSAPGRVGRPRRRRPSPSAASR